MKIALIADWLPVFGGAEHVLAEWQHLWPDAPFHTTIVNRRNIGPLQRAQIHTTGLQKWYRLLGRHEPLLELCMRKIEEIDVSGYDVILSSSHAVGKGIIPPSHAVHICYCHTPMRYAWEMEDEYLKDFRIPRFIRGFIKNKLKQIRRWDLTTAKRVDHFIANSSTVQERIRRIYNRDSTVIHPPVDDRFFTVPLVKDGAREDVFLAIGRLVPYKRFDLLIEAAQVLGFKLQIAGTGPEERRLRSLAGTNVEFLGFVQDADLPALYARSKAVLFPQFEDAGVVALEAQACGTPVIAYAQGGVLDTVKNGETGVFFPEQSVDAIGKAMQEFNAIAFSPVRIRQHAEQFSASTFRQKMRAFVEEKD